MLRSNTAVSAGVIGRFFVLRISWAVFGLGVLLALLAATQSARAETKDASADAPSLCEMVEAFDEALQLRFYRANFAPDEAGCHYYANEGCPYSTVAAFRIKVTHVALLGCGADGDCSFLARQVCETDGPSMACQVIMPSPQSQYQVKGRFSAVEGGGWRLTDWMREPGPELTLDRSEIHAVCPELRAEGPSSAMKG